MHKTQVCLLDDLYVEITPFTLLHNLLQCKTPDINKLEGPWPTTYGICRHKRSTIQIQDAQWKWLTTSASQEWISAIGFLSDTEHQLPLDCTQLYDHMDLVCIALGALSPWSIRTRKENTSFSVNLMTTQTCQSTNDSCKDHNLWLVWSQVLPKTALQCPHSTLRILSYPRQCTAVHT